MSTKHKRSKDDNSPTSTKRKQKLKARKHRKAQSQQRSMDDSDLDLLIDGLSSQNKRNSGKQKKKGKKIKVFTPKAPNSKPARPRNISVDSPKANKYAKLRRKNNSMKIVRSKTPDKENRQQTDKSELELAVANERIIMLIEEKKSLQNKINELNETISSLKVSNEILNCNKELTENVDINKNEQYKLEIQQLKKQQTVEINLINKNHEKEINGLKSNLSNLQFEKTKFIKQTQHNEKLYKQKIAMLTTEMEGKDVINKQLKLLKSNIESQLQKQTNLTHQIMSELEESKKRQYAQKTRHKQIMRRSEPILASGCCSRFPFWGKKKVAKPNMDKYVTSYSSFTNGSDTSY